MMREVRALASVIGSLSLMQAMTNMSNPYDSSMQVEETHVVKVQASSDNDRTDLGINTPG